MRLLEELYFGNLDFSGYMPNRADYKKAINKVEHLENALVEALEGENKTQFIDYASAHAELNGLTATETFILGFSAGATVMAEVGCNAIL